MLQFHNSAAIQRMNINRLPVSYFFVYVLQRNVTFTFSIFLLHELTLLLHINHLLFSMELRQVFRRLLDYSVA